MPDHPPEAEQAFASVLVHDRMLVPPAATLLGEALIVTVGVAAALTTCTLTDFEAVPLGVLHVTE